MKVSSRPDKYFKRLNTTIMSGMPIIVVIGVIILAYFLLSSDGSKVVANASVEAVDNINNAVIASVGDINTNPMSSSSSNTLSVIFVSLFIILILIGGLKYLFKFDLYAEVQNIFSDPLLKISMDDKKNNRGRDKINIPGILGGEGGKRRDGGKNRGRGNRRKNQDIEMPIFGSPEVFHIPNNKYNYEEASAICKSFDAKLATYEQLEKAYNNGAEWCSYGWSDNGLALFPIQKKTYNKMQKKKGYEHSCGRPGINGGYIANKHAKFGVNCYGVKPVINNIERRMMEENNIIPKTSEERRIENKIDNYRQDLANVILAPFNNNEWSD